MKVLQRVNAIIKARVIPKKEEAALADFITKAMKEGKFTIQKLPKKEDKS